MSPSSSRFRLALGVMGVVAALSALLLSAPGAALAGFTPTPTDTLSATPTTPPGITPTPPASSGSLVPPILAKTVSVQRARVGDTANFTLSVTNPNNANYGGIVVTDPLPREVDFINATTPVGQATYDAATHTVTFNVGTLAANQSVTLVVTVRFNAQAQPPATINNAAILNGVITSNASLVQMIPSELPATGFPPEETPRWLTVLLIAVAALLPVGLWRVWALARRRPRR